MDCWVLRFSIWVLLILNLALCSRGSDSYYIDCGSSNDVIVGNVTYLSDRSGSRYLSTGQDILADTNVVNSISPFDDSPVLRTARIFTEPSRYTFPITQSGRHWIRLHFYPFVYQTYNMSTATFSVFSQRNTLLSGFTPRNASVREYSVNVTTGNLVITFSPSSNSFAFVNGLEVVSVPDSLITDDAALFNPSGPFRGLVNQALETVWRVNMGGPLVSLVNDTLGRTWVSDSPFLINPDLAANRSNIAAVQYPDFGATDITAPPTVYGTCTRMNSDGNPNNNFNVTWRFTVDPGFQYFIRFHFCDIVSDSSNQLVFNVFVDSSYVIQDLELSQRVHLANAWFADFVTPLVGRNSLSVSIGPSPRSGYPDALLSGLEIMKMNNSRGSLAAGNSVMPRFRRSTNVVMIVGVSIGAVVAMLLVAGILFFVNRRRKLERLQSKTWVPISINGEFSHTMGSKASNGTTVSVGSMSYRIPFIALQEGTNNFDESWVIGVGGFGKVYKGVLNDDLKVAVKRGNPRSQQGLAEFRTEIEMLSQFRHRHLVSLIGYCDEKNEMILVYEYMENGTLKGHLYGSNLPSLGWKQRLEICIGSARGLHYLHTAHTKAVIHRDVKSANILLDENLMAKVADFGLSKAGPELDQTHVSTAVKGSFGYLDPEYFRRQQLTEKSDVYSFGVVLFEVMCARPVIDPSLPREKVNLAEWAMKSQNQGQIERIIDPNLIGKVKADSLRKFAETAEKCLAEYGVDRPPMAEVLWNLEYALELHESVLQNDPEENSTNAIGQLSPRVAEFNSVDTSSSKGDTGSSKVDTSPSKVDTSPSKVDTSPSNVDTSPSNEQFESSSVVELTDISMSKVFSQLVNSEGR